MTPMKSKELPLKQDEAIAWVTLDPRTRQFIAVKVHQKHLRFACQRCAIFCCRLGGPSLDHSDIARIAERGHNLKDFLDQSIRSGNRGSKALSTVLKSKPDGSCIFLRPSFEGTCPACAIYDSRPSLCKLYPFHLELITPTSLRLEIIPCCYGLNTPTGELVDEDFIIQYLREPIIDALRGGSL